MENVVKANCPECESIGFSVAAQTIKHHIKTPWLWDDGGKGYYFCASQGCDVVYFTSNISIVQNELRTVIGIKSSFDDALICYCFNVNRVNGSDEAKAYVIAQTKAGQCACKTRNPSGRCCLKDFP